MGLNVLMTYRIWYKRGHLWLKHLIIQQKKTPLWTPQVHLFWFGQVLKNIFFHALRID